MDKNNIMKIASIMIVLLLAVLILIFMHYLSNREEVTIVRKPITTPSNTSSGEVKEAKPSGEEGKQLEDSGEENVIPVEVVENKEPQKEENNKPSKDNKNDNKNDKTQNSGENISQLPNTIINVSDNNKQEPVITSSVSTSNQEKQQVLDELDDALKGLLEVVGSVPTVDENKLDASLESEVQP